MPSVDGDQVALHVRVVRGELRHGVQRGAFHDRQARVAVLDAVRRRGLGAQPGLRSRGVRVFPEVEHNDFRVGVGLFVFEREEERKVRVFSPSAYDFFGRRFLRPRKKEMGEKIGGTHREPHRRGVARVEPDLADGLDGRHARKGDLHLAEEVGGARVALGDVLRRERVCLFCFCFGVREREREEREEERKNEGKKETKKKLFTKPMASSICSPSVYRWSISACLHFAPVMTALSWACPGCGEAGEESLTAPKQRSAVVAARERALAKDEGAPPLPLPVAAAFVEAFESSSEEREAPNLLGRLTVPAGESAAIVFWGENVRKSVSEGRRGAKKKGMGTVLVGLANEKKKLEKKKNYSLLSSVSLSPLSFSSLLFHELLLTTPRKETGRDCLECEKENLEKRKDDKTVKKTKEKPSRGQKREKRERGTRSQSLSLSSLHCSV